MNDLTVIAASLRMSSVEIADLTGKEHFHVMRDIRVMLTELHGESGPSSFGSSYLNSQNKEHPCFMLPKRETLILVSGYSIPLRAKIIDRWQALEEQVAKPAIDPANLSRLQLIELAMQAEQERLALEAKVGELAPKAEALDRISTADVGSLCITNAAKALQVPPKKLFSWMQEHQWIYRRAGTPGWIAYQHRIQCGWLEHKVTTVERSDGTEKVVEQVLVTPKGLAKLSAFVELKGLPA